MLLECAPATQLQDSADPTLLHELNLKQLLVETVTVNMRAIRCRNKAIEVPWRMVKNFTTEGFLLNSQTRIEHHYLLLEFQGLVQTENKSHYKAEMDTQTHKNVV